MVCKTIGTRVRISCQSCESCLNSRQTQRLRKIRVEVNGVMLDEGGAVIGVLLAAPYAASGLAPVMATLR